MEVNGDFFLISASISLTLYLFTLSLYPSHSLSIPLSPFFSIFSPSYYGLKDIIRERRKLKKREKEREKKVEREIRKKRGRDREVKREGGKDIKRDI